MKSWKMGAIEVIGALLGLIWGLFSLVLWHFHDMPHTLAPSFIVKILIFPPFLVEFIFELIWEPPTHMTEGFLFNIIPILLGGIVGYIVFKRLNEMEVFEWSERVSEMEATEQSKSKINIKYPIEGFVLAHLIQYFILIFTIYSETGSEMIGYFIVFGPIIIIFKEGALLIDIFGLILGYFFGEHVLKKRGNN